MVYVIKATYLMREHDAETRSYRYVHITKVLYIYTLEADARTKFNTLCASIPYYQLLNYKLYTWDTQTQQTHELETYSV